MVEPMTARKPTRRPAQRFHVLVGLDYPVGAKHVRREPGDIADDIPAKSIPWLLLEGLIEPDEEVN